MLCGAFLAMVLIGGILKYVLNVYAGVVAERMLRRQRYELYKQVVRFPLPHLRRVSTGELVQMINSETEALGGFVGDALAVPAFQGGTLLTSLLFIFMQDWKLGIAAIALYPGQMWLIPKLQRRVNSFGKLRVRQVRKNAERISEMAAGVRDIRSNDAAQYELARFSEELGEVYWIRFDIYKLKFLIKFLNNFIAQLGPFFFFSIGGYLVIKGQITLGALVAVVGAHKDLSAPWKELLSYYQNLFDVKVKYEQTVIQFMPPGIIDEARLELRPAGRRGDREPAQGPVPDHRRRGRPRADHREPQRRGRPAGPARDRRGGRQRPRGADARARRPDPAAGRQSPLRRRRGRHPAGLRDRPPLRLCQHDQLHLRRQPPGQPPVRPAAPAAARARDPARAEARHRRERVEAERSGSSPYDPEAEWTDWAQAGVTREEERLPAIIHALRVSVLEGDVYVLGLRGTVGPHHGDLPDHLLEARHAMQARLLADERLARLVEPFHPDRYNTNATLAENLLFGVPVDERFDIERLAGNAQIRATLDATGLMPELVQVGLRSPGRCSSCSPTCRRTTSISGSSASSPRTSCRPTGPSRARRGGRASSLPSRIATGCCRCRSSSYRPGIGWA